MLSLALLTLLVACDGGDTPPASQPTAAPITPAPAPAPEPADAAVATAAPSEQASAWEQLRLDKAEASSFLKSNWNKYNENYHPNYVLDGNPRTAWVEGVGGDGIHEWLDLPLSELKSARAVKLRIRNGYQKSDTLLTANAAPRQLRLTALYHHGEVASQIFELERKMGWQEVELKIPAGSGLDRLNLGIVTTHPGSKYEDTCVSDIEVFVDSEVPYNAGQEQQKHKALLAWVSERVETARYFAEEAGGYPFTSTHFDTTEADASRRTVDTSMSPGRAALKKMQAITQWQALSATHSIPVLPDGLYMTKALQPMFTPQELRFAPATEALADHEKTAETDGQYEMWSEEIWRSHVKVRPAADGRPQTLYFWEKSIVHGRGTYETKTEYVVEFGDDGAIDWIFASSIGSSEMGPEHNETMTTFRQQGGKVMPVYRDTLTTFEQEEAADYVSRQQYRS